MTVAFFRTTTLMVEDMSTLALGLDPIEQRLDLVNIKLTEVGFADTHQERSDMLLAALRTGVCQEEFVYLEDIACG
jgi:hypothetical protein